MSKGFSAILKIAVMIAVIALAIASTLYVLDVFEDAAIKEAMVKIMSIVGIFTVTAFLLLIVGNIGGQKPSSSD